MDSNPAVKSPFVCQLPIEDPEWIFEQGALSDLLADLGFLPGLIEYMDALAMQTAGSAPERSAFVEAGKNWLAGHLPDPGSCEEHLQMLLAVAGFPKLIARHRERGLPPEITAATARDFQRWMVEAPENSGQWGFTKLKWLSRHIHSGLLEIGRLQYVPIPFLLPYRVYARKGNSKEIYAFPDAGLWCSESGWLEKGATGFQTTLVEDGKVIQGNSVDLDTGRIQSQLTSLGAEDFELLLSQETPILDIHIPGGAALDPDACASSLKNAKRIFDQHFPEIAWKAFFCTSWLLDRELRKCLPSAFNIVAFGNLFSALATPNGSFGQLFDRVLDNTPDWKSFTPRTKLQAAIIRHMHKGGMFRLTSGFILPERDNQ